MVNPSLHNSSLIKELVRRVDIASLLHHCKLLVLGDGRPAGTVDPLVTHHQEDHNQCGAQYHQQGPYRHEHVDKKVDRRAFIR